MQLITRGLICSNSAASFCTQLAIFSGEGSSIAPLNDHLVDEVFSAQANHYGLTVGWRSLADYFTRLEQRTHPTINLATFVGAGGVRQYVIGETDRAATPAELTEMKQLVASGD